ncbi:MAG: 50S ribosomal protein L23 [Flavobacteriia bacterium]|nr:MAG: 50S ribosomal protein L23 [Flavobacteriia bacterium]
MSILIKPIITEKATLESELYSRYGFIVDKRANKLQIKKAVEDTYGVDVESVRTINYHFERKTKYTKKGVVTGKTGGYKKAIVQLSEGQNIDFYNNL